MVATTRVEETDTQVHTTVHETVPVATISAWMDGDEDIHPEALDTPYGRRVWDTYHLIGDVMRNSSLAMHPNPNFYAQVSEAIANEPSLAVARWSWRRTGVSGLAVAAVVATLVWVARPYFMGADVGANSTAVLASTQEAAGLSDYLEAHREITGVGGIQRASFRVRP